MGALAKPLVVVELERLAEVLDLTDGEHRLEVTYENGLLRSWWTHHERGRPEDLRRYDERASLLFRPV